MEASANEERRTNTAAYYFEIVRIIQSKGVYWFINSRHHRGNGHYKGGDLSEISNKDEIAVEAFKYAGQILMEQFVLAVKNEDTAINKIMSLCNVHKDTVNNPPIQGGCPLLNAAVESDAGYPILHDKALVAYEEFLDLVKNILVQGVINEELQPETDVDSISSFILSSLEGGVMASRLSRDNKHIRFVIQQLRHLLTSYSIK